MAAHELETSSQLEELRRGLKDEPGSDYRGLFDAIPQPAWVFDRRTLQFLAVNDAAVQQYGFSRDEFLRMSIAQIQPDEAPHAPDSYTLGRHRTKDGTRIAVEVHRGRTEFQGREAEIVVAQDVTERRRVDRDLSIQYEIACICAECRTIEAAAPRILGAICQALGWQFGGLWRVDSPEGGLRYLAAWRGGAESLAEFEQACWRTTFLPGVGLPGRIWSSSAPAWIPDLLADTNFPRSAAACHAGLQAAFGFPIVLEGAVVGVAEFFSHAIQAPDSGLLQVMTNVGVQIGYYVERVQAETALRESETRFRSLFEEAPIAYHEVDSQGIIRRVNRAECDLLGFPAKNILGRPAWDFVVAEQREAKRELFRQLMAGEQTAGPCDFDFERADGSRCMSVVYPSRIEDGDGKVTGVRWARLDITAQKQAERAREEQSRLAELSTDVTNAMVSFQSLDACLQHCAEALVWRLDAAFTRIWTLNRADQVLELRASAGMYTHLNGAHSRIPVGKFKIGLIAEERRPHLTNAVIGDPRVGDQEWAKREGMVAFAGYPLMANDEVIGVLAMFSRKPLTDNGFQALGRAALEIAVVVDKKTGEEALLASEQRYRRIVETAAEGIWIFDGRARTTFVNRRMAEMTGFEPEEMLGRSARRFISPQDRKSMLERYASLRRGNKETFDVRLRRADGSELWASVSAAPILDDGNFLGILCMSTDVTQRKQAEDALRASEEFNKLIVESSGDGILVLDTAGRLLYLSPSAQQVLEIRDGNAFLGALWLDSWNGESRQLLETTLQRAMNGEAGSFEGTCSTALGATRRLDVSLNAIRDSGSAQLRLVALIRDITERKKLEGQLAQAQKLESIGQLAAGIAHEINTPIQYIGDNGRFLQDAFGQLKPIFELDQLPAECREDVEYFQEEIPKSIGQLLEGVEHVARIVRAMKEFSHPGPVEKVAVDLNHAIRSTIVVSRNEWKYVANMVEDFDPELPPVHCVPGEINQVVLNLIVNAAHAIAGVVKDGEQGTITISTLRRGGWAEIRVRDTGTGIPESVRSKVFDPFFTTKEVGKGTGQGLALAHTVVVKNHGGTIHFETEVGTGTTFVVRLPIAGT